MDPVILHQGVRVRVTPDTAADLVGRGLAVLVEGSLPAPLPPSPPVEPADEPEPPKQTVEADAPPTDDAPPPKRRRAAP